MKRVQLFFSPIFWKRMTKMRRLLRFLLLRSALTFLAAQVGVIITLVFIDSWRKRFRAQGHFPRARLPHVCIGETEVQLYTYGAYLYGDMLRAIREARTRICFETFIWKDDDIGQRFKKELQSAANRGVEVYAIYDSFANLVVPGRFKHFSPAMHVLRYPLLAWLTRPLSLSSYARDHRKILVVDSQIAFVGGFNIGMAYATEWRDTHVRISGPDARELENIFIDFWNVNHRHNLPMLPEGGPRDWDPLVMLHRNDPQLLIFPIRNSYLEAIDRSTRHIYLTHAYFIPDRAILGALLHAAARGVDVRILLPETSNHVLADWLARGFYSQCLAGGVRLFLYQHAMVHAKTATIDSIWSTVGTANLDRLSMVGNFEVNVEFYSEELARQMEEVFAMDSTNTRELTLAEWKKRSLLYKFAEAILLPLRPLL